MSFLINTQERRRTAFLFELMGFLIILKYIYIYIYIWKEREREDGVRGARRTGLPAYRRTGVLAYRRTGFPSNV